MGFSTGEGCHAPLQGIFPTQGLNLRLLWLLHWRRILSCWAIGETQIQYKSKINFTYFFFSLWMWLRKTFNYFVSSYYCYCSRPWLFSEPGGEYYPRDKHCPFLDFLSLRWCNCHPSWRLGISIFSLSMEPVKGWRSWRTVLNVDHWIHNSKSRRQLKAPLDSSWDFWLALLFYLNYLLSSQQ